MNVRMTGWMDGCEDHGKHRGWDGIMDSSMERKIGWTDLRMMGGWMDGSLDVKMMGIEDWMDERMWEWRKEYSVDGWIVWWLWGWKMDGWMWRWWEGRLHGWADWCENHEKEGRLEKLIDRHKDEVKADWMDGKEMRMDRWLDERTDGRNESSLWLANQITIIQLHIYTNTN